MWHPRCEEATRLLDCYLVALTNEDAAGQALHRGQITVKEAQTVKESLASVRNRYLQHVMWHDCRGESEALQVARALIRHSWLHRPARCQPRRGVEPKPQGALRRCG